MSDQHGQCGAAGRRRAGGPRARRTAHARQRGAALWVWLALCSTLVASGALRAGEPIRGAPPFTRHAIDVASYPQNFGLDQAPDGTVYIANYGGLIEYDGVDWRLLPMPNHDAVRSLAVDGRGRVYVGGSGLFGHFDRDETGELRYTDLTGKLPADEDDSDFGAVRQVLLHGSEVFFRAATRLFRYQPRTGQLAVYRSASRLQAMGLWKSRPVVHEAGVGLLSWNGSRWSLLPGSETMPEYTYALVELATGELLPVTSGAKWQVYDGRGLRDWQAPRRMPPPSALRSAIALSGGALAMVDTTGMLHVVDVRERRVRAVSLTSEKLHQVLESKRSGLLSLSDTELFQVDWPSSVTVLNELQGLRGSVWAMRRWGDRWIAVTDAGFQELVQPDDGEPQFRRLPWSQIEAWDLLGLGPDEALLAEGGAVRLWKAGKRHPVLPAVPAAKKLVASPSHPDRVYVGTFDGLVVLQRQSGNWLPSLRVPGLDVAQIHEDGDALWVGTETDGVHRLKLDPTATRVLRQQRFAAEQGVKPNRAGGAGVFPDGNGGWLASSEYGLWVWDGNAFQRDDRTGLDQLRPDGELLSVAIGPDRTRWAFSYRTVLRQRHGGAWERVPVGRIRHGAIDDVRFDVDGSALFSAGRSVIRISPFPAPRSVARIPVQLRAVEYVWPDGRSKRLPLQGHFEFPAGEFGIRVRYAVTDLAQPDAVRYSYRFGPPDAPYSQWSASPQVTVFNIEPGEYVLAVRGRDGGGYVTELTPITVTIRPPWWGTAWARGGFALLGLFALLGCLYAISGWRTRKIRAQRRELMRTVQQRTRELRAANERLNQLASSDALTGAANRRRLDEYLAEVWGRARAEGGKISVLAIDIDHFKRYNDVNGHLDGDRMIVGVVGAIRDCLADGQSLLARYGGDEFMVVLPFCSRRAALERAEAIRAAVEALPFGVTVSIGVATLDGRQVDAEPAERLLRAADAALYRAKADGKNCVRSVDSVTDLQARRDTRRD